MTFLKRLLIVVFVSVGTAAVLIPATPAVAQNTPAEVSDLIDIRIAQLQAQIDAFGDPPTPAEQAIIIANTNRIAELEAIQGVLAFLPPTTLQVLYEFFLERISPTVPVFDGGNDNRQLIPAWRQRALRGHS